MNLTNLNSFLKLGYFLDFHGDDCDFRFIDKDKYKDESESNLIDLGHKLWKSAIEESFETNKKNVVPISGGLDSRIILAELLEFTEASNIETYTFGTPGTIDFEIGNLIAKKTGIKHHSFPLTSHKFSLEEELYFSKNSKMQTVLFHHPPIFDVKEKFSDYNIWSGFGGDNRAGSHLGENEKSNIKQSIDSFVKKNTFVKSTDLLYKDTNNFCDLLDTDFIDEKKVTLIEQLDFKNRQEKYIKPHVLIEGFNYKLPFCNEKINNFFLSLDNERHRRNITFYKKMVLECYPKLFKIGTSSNFGLPLEASKTQILFKRINQRLKRELNKFGGFYENPNTNYIDFNQAIRHKKDLKDLIYSSIMDLKSRNIVDWIEIDKLWDVHQNTKIDHSDALLVLASLEIHLKNGKKI